MLWKKYMYFHVYFMFFPPVVKLLYCICTFWMYGAWSLNSNALLVSIYFASLDWNLLTERETCLLVSQLVWLGINAFLFVFFYMKYLGDSWFYTRELLGVSPTRPQRLLITIKFHEKLYKSIITHLLWGDAATFLSSVLFLESKIITHISGREDILLYISISIKI